MFLLVDNYDSFTWNIYHSIASKGMDISVQRSDKINLDNINNSNYIGIIFSPGPGHPNDSFSMMNIIKNYKKKIPLLGICLGHQALAHSFGAKINKMKKVMHGKTDKIFVIKKKKNLWKVSDKFFCY